MLTGKNLSLSLDHHGCTVTEPLVEEPLLERLQQEVALLETVPGVRSRDEIYAVRNALSLLPTAGAIAASEPIRDIVTAILGPTAFAVRGVYFDKPPSANWRVPWHQDAFIAVRERAEVEGYTAWTTKAGVPHVRPPAEVLEQMVTVRVHLDDTDESTGGLRVLRGSHTNGYANAAAIREWVSIGWITPEVPRGAAMIMRPLLLHASGKASVPSHRRILHIEFAARELTPPLAWYERHPLTSVS